MAIWQNCLPNFIPPDSGRNHRGRVKTSSLQLTQLDLKVLCTHLSSLTLEECLGLWSSIRVVATTCVIYSRQTPAHWFVSSPENLWHRFHSLPRAIFHSCLRQFFIYFIGCLGDILFISLLPGTIFHWLPGRCFIYFIARAIFGLLPILCNTITISFRNPWSEQFII